MKRSVFFTLAIAAFAVGSCNLYPESEAMVEDLDMVLTNYDTKVDFSQFKTYAIVDEVLPVSNDIVDENPQIIDKEFSDYILSVINHNMQALGYEKVDTNGHPDVAINAGAALTRNITVYTYYPDYYYWYGGSWYYPGDWWGYPSYGYYYPWYPVTSVSSYEIGTLFIDMIDLKNAVARQDSTMKVLWSATVRGIVSSSGANNKERARVNIDQAFAQSPYLNTRINQ